MRVLAGAVLVGSLALAGCAQEPPPVSEKVAKVFAEQQARATEGPSKTPAPKVKVAAGAKVAFFGDSWTYGQSAEPITEGFAYETERALRLDADVLGDPGTGYLATGVKQTGTYLERMKKLPVSDASVLILQGSINDASLYIQPTADLAGSVQAVFAEAKVKFPKAKIIVLGPAPNDAPASDVMVRLDDIMKYWSDQAGYHYISPVQEEWITEDNVNTVIDPATEHPSIVGHQYLAERLVADIR